MPSGSQVKHEWFRRTSWSEKDREEFEAKLARARRTSRAQYLRIQALCLAEMGDLALVKASLALVDRLLAEYPDDRIERASALKQRAECHARLGDNAAAVEAFRLNLHAEREFPNAQTDAWLGFGWLVVRNRLVDLYEEVAGVLDERGRDPSALTFPALRYKYHAIRALLASASADRKIAVAEARMALEAAGLKHSGFRYHKDVGLVRILDPQVHERIVKLAAEGNS